MASVTVESLLERNKSVIFDPFLSLSCAWRSFPQRDLQGLASSPSVCWYLEKYGSQRKERCYSHQYVQCGYLFLSNICLLHFLVTCVDFRRVPGEFFGLKTTGSISYYFSYSSSYICCSRWCARIAYSRREGHESSWYYHCSWYVDWLYRYCIWRV